MLDKSWMLNPQAIRHAKTCIQIIQERKNIKLKLSQTDFFDQLAECSRKIRSAELVAAYHQLMAMAEVNTSGEESDSKIVKLFGGRKPTINIRPVDSIETVKHDGKHYPKWQAGKAFQGMHLGQPLYQ